MLNAELTTTGAFVREHLRAPLTRVLLVAVPSFFVLIFASVVGDFARALGGTLASQSATAISAGWAAAFLSGTLAFFQVSSSRSADRRLAAAGLGVWRAAGARIAAALAIGTTVAVVAFVALLLRSGIAHPAHAFAAILSFSVIYIGLGALIGAFVSDQLEGSLLVVLLFSVDAFTSPEMTSSDPLTWTPTRKAAEILIAGGGGQASPGADWVGMLAVAAGALTIAWIAFWSAARSRS